MFYKEIVQLCVADVSSPTIAHIEALSCAARADPSCHNIINFLAIIEVTVCKVQVPAL